MIMSEELSLSNITDLACPKSSDSTSNPPKTELSYCNIGDEFCGEPLPSQHITINFKPLDSIDNDFVQKKCCACWEFLRSRQELRHLMVYPEKGVYTDKPTSHETSSTEISIKSEYDEISVKPMRTAVSMLEIVEKKGLIDRTFEAKLPQSMCSLGSREYHENEANPISAKSIRKNKIKACTCSGVCRTCKQKPIDAPPSSASPRVKNLCTKMKEWDQRHPKSMEPPGHPPALIHSTMQRKV
ncbi:hypothetical protein K1T71_006946 [Dendrolimus kikuchii]|uniref:Uncharacterized protein n=1 Tax=Dendrolimus kikuchii TaxID=765133 RepID=A0ACC1D078_9NEOP|nr:hypothetical protein K1T71_006946 [Dendrolimus kikuchii]